MSRLVLPLLGLAAGSTMAVIGASQLATVFLARDNEIKKEEKKVVGGVAAGFVVLGTILQAASSYELAQSDWGRRG